MTAPTVLVAGSANVDLSVRVPRLPGPGETVVGGPVTRTLGGKGVNQAIAAHRAGARVELRACVGADSVGDWLVARLAAEGLAVEGIQRPAGPPGTALVIVNEAGENQIVASPGANAFATPDGLDPWPSPAVALVQQEIPAATVAAALRRGRSAGAVTVLNAAPAAEVPAATLRHVDLLVVNEHEFAAALGVPFRPGVRRAPGWPVVLVTLGGRGAVVLDGDTVWSVPAFAVPVVDTVAAGDAFCGVLAASLAAGRPLREAVRWANAAGAVTVTRSGAAAALPTRAEIEELLARGAPGPARRARAGPGQ